MEGTARFEGTDDDRPVGTDDDRPVGELVHALSQQTATLIRQEIRLAQVELREKGRRMGLGAGM